MTNSLHANSFKPNAMTTRAIGRDITHQMTN